MRESRQISSRNRFLAPKETGTKIANANLKGVLNNLIPLKVSSSAERIEKGQEEEKVNKRKRTFSATVGDLSR